MSKFHIQQQHLRYRFIPHQQLVVTFLIVLISGCSFAPKYERPNVDIALQYPQGDAYPKTYIHPKNAENVLDIGWRAFFKDPLLQQLIEHALANNHDLKIAALNVAALEAQYRIRRADLFPHLSTNADATVQKLPSDIAYNRRIYQLGLSSVAWELDLWGRLRNLNEQALQNYLASDETRTAVHMSLVSAVARAYMTLQANHEQLSLTRATVQAQQQSYELTKALVKNGQATQFDLSLAEMSLRAAQFDQSKMVRLVAQDRNALILLMGTPLSQSIALELDQAKDLSDRKLLSQISAGLPSDLLMRRPDIRAAEHMLLGANANIGVARAAFFPSIQLTGSVGIASSSLSDLFDSGTGMWNFIPKISLPIFHAGANRANLNHAQVLKRIEIVNYNKAIQTAFREVSDHLAGQATLDEQIKTQQQSVNASEKAYQLAKLRFKAGQDNYFVVLDLERTLYAAQQQLIQTRLEQLNNEIQLYKALGGGWIR
ncbi:efflux transporter outer membrane subunit [Acinetobacter bereziniae]|uniref:efflux transporter outer membrane subunit n=1 Tax=Acinetobacter bereziniae TaxID=106648 RepID=UPI0022EAAE08|nr:efflux transporter outer membrane subunit [Acinetobacter bereziniae]MDA3440095.1 efflux transporter outer membrane subunit [Acinetobacter bereziniae]